MTVVSAKQATVGTHFLHPDNGFAASVCVQPVSAMTAKNQLSTRQQHDSTARRGSSVNVSNAIYSHRHKNIVIMSHSVSPGTYTSANSLSLSLTFFIWSS